MPQSGRQTANEMKRVFSLGGAPRRSPCGVCVQRGKRWTDLPGRIVAVHFPVNPIPSSIIFLSFMWEADYVTNLLAAQL